MQNIDYFIENFRLSIILCLTCICLNTPLYSQKKYQNSFPKLSVNVPTDWEIEVSKQSKSDISVLHESGASINIILDRNHSLARNTLSMLDNVTLINEVNQLPESLVKSISQIEIADIPALKYNVEWTYTEADFSIDLITRIVFISYNNTLISINFTASHKDFNLLEPDFLQLLSGIEFDSNSDYTIQRATKESNYSSSKDGFSIDFPSKPNKSSTEDMTTYSATDLESFTMYRVTVTDLTYEEGSNYRTHFINAYMKNFSDTNFEYYYTDFEGDLAIVFSGQQDVVNISGDDLVAFHKNIAFIKGKKFFHLSVLGSEHNVDFNFDKFIGSLSIHE